MELIRKVKEKVKKRVCEKEAERESIWFEGRLGKRRRKSSTKVKEIVRINRVSDYHKKIDRNTKE